MYEIEEKIVQRGHWKWIEYRNDSLLKLRGIKISENINKTKKEYLDNLLLFFFQILFWKNTDLDWLLYQSMVSLSNVFVTKTIVNKLEKIVTIHPYIFIFYACNTDKHLHSSDIFFGSKLEENDDRSVYVESRSVLGQHCNLLFSRSIFIFTLQ